MNPVWQVPYVFENAMASILRCSGILPLAHRSIACVDGIILLQRDGLFHASITSGT